MQLEEIVLVVTVLRMHGRSTNLINLAAWSKNTKSEFILQNIAGAEAVSKIRDIRQVTSHKLQNFKCAVQLRRLAPADEWETQANLPTEQAGVCNIATAKFAW